MKNIQNPDYFVWFSKGTKKMAAEKWQLFEKRTIQHPEYFVPFKHWSSTVFWILTVCIK
jgi:hypothetical protein